MDTPQRPAAEPAYIGGLSRAPSGRLNRGLVTVALVVVTVAAGVYLKGVYDSKEGDRLAVAEVQRLTERINEEEAWLEAAIRRKRVILGMNMSEVRMAKGAPHRVLRNESLPVEHRTFGGVECWIYQSAEGPGSVLFGAKGLVIYSADTAGQLRMGNAVRQ